MNIIDNIEIKNFKSIRHQKIEGCRRINVFIGYPNVGKSNILEALSGFAYAQKFKPNFHSMCRYETFRDLMFNGNIGLVNTASINLNGNIILRYKYNTPASLVINGSIYPSEDLDTIPIENIDFNSATKESFYFNFDEDGEPSGSSFEENSFPIVKKYDFEKSKINNKVSSNPGLSVPFGDNLANIVESNPIIRKQVAELFKEYNLKILLERGERGMRIAKVFEDETIFQYRLVTRQRLYKGWYFKRRQL